MDQPFIEGSFTMPRRKSNKVVQVPKLAIIKWLDAFDGPTGWVDPETYNPHPVTPYSVGWVIEGVIQDHVSLVGTYLVDCNEDIPDSKAVYYSNPAHIPTGMIQSITYIDIPSDIRDSIIQNLHIRGFNAG